MSTVLVIGSAADACEAAVRLELERRGADVVIVTGADVRSALGLGGTFRGTEITECIGLRQLPLEDLAGVLVRVGCHFGWNAPAPDKDQASIQAELRAAHVPLFEKLRCRVVNRLPCLDVDAMPFRYAQVARALQICGFAVPPGYRSAAPPCLPQPIPAGRWMRVLVVAGRTIPAHASPQDPKEPASALRMCLSPICRSAFGHRCGRLARKLGLVFFEMSLLRGADGQDYCFALNDHPALEAWEPFVQQRVAAALADQFLSAAKKAAA